MENELLKIDNDKNIINFMFLFCTHTFNSYICWYYGDMFNNVKNIWNDYENYEDYEIYEKFIVKSTGCDYVLQIDWDWKKKINFNIKTLINKKYENNDMKLFDEKNIYLKLNHLKYIDSFVVINFLKLFREVEFNDERTKKQLEYLNDIIFDLSSNSHSIFNIAMGIGKTFILAPLIILHWCENKKISSNYLTFVTLDKLLNQSFFDFLNKYIHLMCDVTIHYNEIVLNDENENKKKLFFVDWSKLKKYIIDFNDHDFEHFYKNNIFIIDEYDWIVNPYKTILNKKINEFSKNIDAKILLDLIKYDFDDINCFIDDKIYNGDNKIIYKNIKICLEKVKLLEYKKQYGFFIIDEQKKHNIKPYSNLNTISTNSQFR